MKGTQVYKSQIKAAEAYARLWIALKRIASYQTPEQLKRHSQRDWALESSEALEYAYENVLQEAKNALKGSRKPKPII